MNSYLFSVGNSTTGPVGYCIRVQAQSEERALALVQEQVWKYEMGVTIDCDAPAVEYFQVYFNPEDITLDDIEEVNENVELESPPESGV